MYASNEDEFNQDDGDWVFLREVPPTNTIFHGAVNLTDADETTSSSSSSSSSDSSSSTPDPNESTSSLSSTENEHVLDDEQENNLLIEAPVLTSHINDDTNESLLIDEIKEEVLPTEIPIKHIIDTETSPIINEYKDDSLLIDDNKEEFSPTEIPIKQIIDIETSPIINEYDLNDESVTLSNNLRQRSGANAQQTDDQYSSTVEHERRPSTVYDYRPRRNNTLLIYGVLILLFVLPVILCRYITTQRLIINKITQDLQKTNQRLNEIKILSLEDIEQKLMKQYEEKFQHILHQKMNEYDQEKYSLILQINELYHITHITQQNLTNTIQQLSNENQRLQNQMIELEQRLKVTEEQDSKDKETCSEGDDCMKSSLESLLRNLIKQTTTIAEDTSTNLSTVFEQLSASISDFVDRRHEYVEESKRKLSDFASSSTAEKVHKTIRRSVENFSSSIHKAQSTYSTWIRSRAQQREQARMDNIKQEEKPTRHPWRWTFQRSHDREQMRHQTPVTKLHSSNKEHVCHSKYEFPVHQLCSMKNWMEKFFRP
ncbi:unnamed protein product [Adineta steineri]|uniref:Uncharacterized protein n=1 Tax=Adineta steineri TaxID=433720 RepID=A0A813Q0A3_9BILA|nr:unnamed protein product [Adineta steineri]CAF3525883.1 unnamed protein product [Adineta steineri]